LESYGCQMNFSDSEIVASILNEQGYNTTLNQEEADLILLNTCSIREKAEQTVRMRFLSSKILKKKNQILRLVFLAVWLNVLKPNSWKKNNWLIWLLVRCLQRSSKSFKRNRRRKRCHQRNSFKRRNLCRYQSGSFRRKWRYSFCYHYKRL
jgi:hypothetical protein